MTIITVTLRVLDHTIVELTIDASTELAELTDDPDTVIVHDVNLANFNHDEP